MEQGQVRMRIAIVGSGISGLGTAWLLSKAGHAVTVFEANDYLGGHTHTVDVTLDGITAPVDTGFLVFNDRTYPHLVAMFGELGVTSVPSEMSFAVSVAGADVEWAGTDLASLFAQPRNALRPAFWRMLADVLRFNRATTAIVRDEAAWSVTLGEYLDVERYSTPFRDWYLLPMAAAIWSAPTREILDSPLRSFLQFCHNHGLLQIFDRPQWRTVEGGAREYVARIASRLTDVRIGTPVTRVRRNRGGIEIEAAGRAERFDEVVLACHSDQTLALLGDPSRGEIELLSSVRYQPNRVVLHTDTALLPRSPRAWSAWNYLTDARADGAQPAAVSYLINKLQPLPFRTPVIVTLNPPREPDPAKLLQEFEYSHPLLDGRARRAQAAFGDLQGSRHTWFAGAWLGHGFHEDGLRSAHAVAAGLLRRVQAPATPSMPQRTAA
jgi:predicted NAD/FAD-binding protein